MARTCADAAFPAKGNRSLARAHGTFLDRAAASFVQSALDVLGSDVESADVVEPAIVGFTDDGINAEDVFVSGLRQGPANQSGRGLPDAQSIGEHDRCFDLSELDDLCGADELAKRVEDKNCTRAFVLKNIPRVRQNGRDSRSDVFAFDDSDLTHLDAGDVGDGVVRAGIVDTWMNTQFARSRPMRRFGLLRQKAGS